MEARKSTEKGNIGEYKVRQELKRLPQDEYRVLNDILIENEYGTAQIDHLVVSLYGIYVIETKNYSGNVYGDEYQEKWYQYVGNKKIEFYNPIKQNWYHIKALKNVLKDYPNVPFYSIIVFTGSAKLKSIDANTDVLYLNQLNEKILRNKNQYFNRESIAYIYSRISERNINRCKDNREYNTYRENNARNNYRQANGNYNNFEKNNQYYTQNGYRKQYISEDLKRKISKYINLEVNHNVKQNISSIQRRAAAIFIDFMALLTPAYYGSKTKAGSYAFLILFIVIYQIYLWSKGKSIGKRILRMKTLNSKTGQTASFARMVIRETFLKYLSGLISGFGFALALVSPTNRTLHDLLGGTVVVDDKKF